MLIGYEAVPAMPQPDSIAHARLSQPASRCAPSTSGIPHEMPGTESGTNTAGKKLLQ